MKVIGRLLVLLTVVAVAGAHSVVPANAAEEGGLTLVSDLPAGQPVGTTITWTVNGAPADATFRLAVTRLGTPQRVVYDFTAANDLKWTPSRDGRYRIVMTVRDSLGTLTPLAAPFFIRPTLAPSVKPTRNPLVALYGAPACQAGLRMRVAFSPAAGGTLMRTHSRACDGVQSMNFYLGGMRAEMTYAVRHSLTNAAGAVVALGPVRFFTTGTPTVTPPGVTVRVPPTADASTGEPVFLFGPTSGAGGPFATDTNGNLIWYYESPTADETDLTLTRPNPGGTIMVIGAGTAEDRLKVREIDLAGNTVRETNARRLSEQFVANGGQVPFTTVHHEARVLPNGKMLVLAHSEVIRPQGGETVDVLSDLIVGLDENMQIEWQWDAFDHLDVERLALLGEVCVSDGPGCPVLFLAPEANDWLHSNAIGYRESDGAIILSIRHQDWVIAIDYADGQGTGSVLWKLGKEGEFTLTDGADPDLFESHQHDNNFLGDNLLLLYDNGNGTQACVADPAACQSRGQLYQIDETSLEASLIHNFILPRYSFALGSAQPMSNGNFHFNSGIIDFAFAYGDEITPAGDVAYSIEVDVPVYRSFRMRDMYTPPSYE